MQLAPENLRVRSLVELLDVSVGTYRDHFLHFLGIAALTQVPVGLLSVLVAAVLFNGQVPSGFATVAEIGTTTPGEVVLAVLASLILGLLGVIVGSFGIAAMLHSVARRLGGRRLDMRESFRGSLGRVPSLLGSRLLFGLAILGVLVPASAAFGIGVFLLSQGDGGGLTLGIVAVLGGLALLAIGLALALFLWVRWRFHSQTAVLEDRSPVASLRRSREVTRNHWWRTLGFVVLLALFIAALGLTPGLVIQVPLALVYGLEYQTQFSASLILNVVAILTRTLLLPVDVIAVTLLYYDQRVRSEALDIEMALAQLREEPAQS